MLPVMLDIEAMPVVLVGDGEAALRRLRLLEEAGAADIRVYLPEGALPELRAAAGARACDGLPDRAAIGAARALFVAESPAAARLAAMARQAGVLVNVEDVTGLCDFYTPSVVRRGDLVIAVSTRGKSPGLARRIRQKIEAMFGPEWAGRLTEIGRLRQSWQAEGADMATIARRTGEWIERNHWL